MLGFLILTYTSYAMIPFGNFALQKIMEYKKIVKLLSIK